MRFGGLVAVNDLSFTANRGNITALIGPNGAGKTTVFNCITGFYKPSEGRIALAHGAARLWDDLDVADAARRPPPRRGPTAPCSCSSACPTIWSHSRARVARTFQNIRLFPGMTVLENLLVAQHNPADGASGYTALGIFGLGHYGRAERAAIEKARHWLDADRPRRPRRRSGRRTALRGAAPARDRPRDVHRSGAAVPRRARRRAQSPRKRGAQRADPRHPRRRTRSRCC